MLDWGARIDELAAYLAAEYRMEDREALEILLSGLMPCPRTHALWLILETNWYARDCAPAWFSFGRTWVPRSLAQIRARQPWRPIEAMLVELLDEPEEERLFVEPDFERYPMFHRVTNALFIVDRSLRLRLIHRRTITALQALDGRAEERRQDQVAALTRAILEDRVGARPPDPPAFVEPPQFAYHAELVHRLAPWFRDWSTLVQALGLLAVRHAYLYGRRETTAEDWRAMARVAADSVPAWITKAIGKLLEGPSQPATIEKAMGLEEKTRRSGHGAHRELVRLRRNGLIEWSRQKMHWSIVEEHRHALAAVVGGHAFTQASASSAA